MRPEYPRSLSRGRSCRVAGGRRRSAGRADTVEPDDARRLWRSHGDLYLLVEPRFSGEALDFVEAGCRGDALRPIYPVNRTGAGEVLYLKLGAAGRTTTRRR